MIFSHVLKSFVMSFYSVCSVSVLLLPNTQKIVIQIPKIVYLGFLNFRLRVLCLLIPSVIDNF